MNSEELFLHLTHSYTKKLPKPVQIDLNVLEFQRKKFFDKQKIK